MTVIHRKAVIDKTDEVQVNEPGIQFSCDACGCDITHAIRIKCAEPTCEQSDDGSGVDICPKCFCEGKEFGPHKPYHPYRVIEFNSYPVLEKDWGADEELLLIRGISSHGIGNWRKIAEHVGTRTKAEVEEHYTNFYVQSPKWPSPINLEKEFVFDPEEFGNRKRRRIEEMNSAPVAPAKVAPVSTPAVHEISGFLPGRLEFEHELDNEAEDLVKDLEFGWVGDYGGCGTQFQDFAGVRVTNISTLPLPAEYKAEDIPTAPPPLVSPDFVLEDPEDGDVKAQIRWEQERVNGPLKRKRTPTPPPPPPPPMPSKAPALPIRTLAQIKGKGVFNAATNGYVDARPHPMISSPPPSSSREHVNGTTEEEDEDDEESMDPVPKETANSLQFKLAILEMYGHRVDKRKEGKKFMFERGFVEYRKMQQQDKKRPKEEREIIHRIKPFVKLTKTQEEFEELSNGIVYEAWLRKKIQELQSFRKLGIQTISDIEKYEIDTNKRTQQKAQQKDYYSGNTLRRGPSIGRGNSLEPGDRDGTPAIKEKEKKSWRAPPLNLSSSPALHLLTPPEQVLCSQLRILPKPYLVIKETLVREYARRGGKLRRREARELVKIDVNKTAKIWDFLVQTGCLKIGDMTSPADMNGRDGQSQQPSGSVAPQGSPTKPSTPTASVSTSSASLTNKPAIPSPLSRQSSVDVVPRTTPGPTISLPGGLRPVTPPIASGLPSFAPPAARIMGAFGSTGSGSMGGLPVMNNIAVANGASGNGGLPVMSNSTSQGK